MGLCCVHLAEHLRRLLDVWDHQTVLQHTGCVDNALTNTHLALGDGQSRRHRYVFHLDAQVSDLLGERRCRLRDVLDCWNPLATRLVLELSNELCHLLFPVLDLLLVRHGDGGAELRDRHGGLGGADHLLLDLLHGLQRSLHQLRRHLFQLALGGVDDVPQCHGLLGQETRTAEGLQRVIHHCTIRAVCLDHVVGALRLHCGHELQQLRGHAGRSAASRGGNHLVLPRHGQLMRSQHAEPAQAARDESHDAWT
mmetsp:Transcript_164545/g.400022  ORF Transcript_164545/g.400022 Transcript_164545/m.400022 type:complete len:253 (-) Transcript_164545:60-818(-)